MYSILKKPTNLLNSSRLKGHKLRALLCPDLEKLIDYLTHLNQSNVENFYRMGELLQSLKEESNNLVDLTLSQGEQDPDSDDNLKNVKESATKALSALDQNSNIIATCNTGIHELSVYFRQLYQRGQVLYKFSTYLRVAALNIEAESSRSEIAKEMFLTFSKELRELSDQVGVLAHDIYNESEKAGKQQSETEHKLDNGSHKLKSFFNEAEKNLQHAAEDISSFIELSDQAQIDSCNYSEGISRNINQLTEAIQFEDISRQKIEHIIESLKEIHGLLKKGKLDKKSSNHIFSLIKVQTAQLKHIQKETFEIKQVLGSAVLSAEQYTQDFSKTKTNPNNHKIAANSGEEMIDELCDKLENIHEIIHSGTELVNFAQNSASQSVNMTERLSDFANNFSALSTEMKLKSLNAIIKSIHLGEEGRVLEVLANKVTDISIDSQKQITEIANLIQKAMTETDKLSSTQTNDAYNVEAFENTIRSVRKKYQQYKDADSQLKSSSRELIHQITAYSNQLDFLDKSARTIEDCNNLLKSLLSTFVKNNPKAKILDSDDSALNSGRYTMNSEREMHQQALQEPGAFTQNTSQVTGGFESFGSDEMNSLDTGGFESFEEEESSDKNKSSKLDDNIELF